MEQPNFKSGPVGNMPLQISFWQDSKFRNLRRQAAAGLLKSFSPENPIEARFGHDRTYPAAFALNHRVVAVTTPFPKP